MCARSSSNKPPIGLIGIAIGLIAILIAVFQVEIERKLDPPPEETIGSLALEAGKRLIKEKILNEKIEETPLPLSKVDYVLAIRVHSHRAGSVLLDKKRSYPYFRSGGITGTDCRCVAICSHCNRKDEIRPLPIFASSPREQI